MVAGPLDRQPSHLLDAAGQRLRVAAHGPRRGPHHRQDLTRIGGPVDVEGGWADAGDYLKFTHSTAYNDVVLFTSARLLGEPRAREPPRRGAPRPRLAGQDVGRAEPAPCTSRSASGSGNRQGTFARRPRPVAAARRPTTTTPTRSTGTSRTARSSTRRRPGSRSAPTSPAGCRRRSPSPRSWTPRPTRPRPAHELHEAQAALRPRRHRALPRARWSPRSPTPSTPSRSGRTTWSSAPPRSPAPRSCSASPRRRTSATPRAGPCGYLRVGLHRHPQPVRRRARSAHVEPRATRWTRCRTAAARRSPAPDLVARPRRTRSGQAADHARHDPFGAAVDVDRVRRQLPHVRPGRQRRALRPADPEPPLPGLRRPRSAPGCSAATRGASARWSASARRTRAACSTRSPTFGSDGTRPDLGAVVNGPNGAGNFEGGLGGFQDRHAALLARRGYRAFDGQGSRYVDDVRAWQTDEPALDMTARRDPRRGRPAADPRRVGRR